MQKIGAFAQAESQGPAMFPHGPHDINHHMHIPVPGRVQYYRAETLPFLPNEIKTQLRFPKAYAVSETNLRYLSQVREQTQAFMKKHVKQNYFTGEQDVPLTATLREVEILFGASDQVKQLSDNGHLSSLHSKVASLQETSERDYLSIRDRIYNIITATQAKEDELYAEIASEYPEASFKHHHANEQSFLSLLSLT
jgi:hypothetical protein